jgi:hypothetical protein
MTTVVTRIVMVRLSFLYVCTLLLAGCAPLGREYVVIKRNADAELTTTVKGGSSSLWPVSAIARSAHS